MVKPIYIEATSIEDAWYQSVYTLARRGNRYKIDEGSFKGADRLEFDYAVIRIKKPGFPENRNSEEDLLPKLSEKYSHIPPMVEPGYLFEYLPYVLSPGIKEDETYTYGQRLFGPGQIEHVVKTYKEKGHRNNQMILQVGKIGDLYISDPPCLRHIDTKIKNDRLHFFPYFRSWDLWGGFPCNVAALQILKEMMADEIGVGDGEMLVSSKGLHVYGYAVDYVNQIGGRI